MHNILQKMFLFFFPVFLYAVTMLIFQIKIIILSKNWFNYVVTLFFFENAKNLGGSDDAKRRKKRGWPKNLEMGHAGSYDPRAIHALLARQILNSTLRGLEYRFARNNIATTTTCLFKEFYSGYDL